LSVPQRQPKNRNNPAAANVGPASNRAAAPKLSVRQPISLSVSPRSLCDQTINPPANAKGTARSQPAPLNGATNHNASRHDTHTETISHAANARLFILSTFICGLLFPEN
jgi:hypothetical protein